MHYVFGDFSLDTARYELRRAGEVVPLRGKVFDVLAYLVSHCDRVVSRDELLDQVWPEQFVAESTLTSCIKAVRQALGDTGRTQRLIKTVHGRGYRCLAPMSPLDPAAPEATLASSAPPQETVLAPHAAPPVGESTPEAIEALVPSSGDAAPVPELPSPPSVAPASVHPCAEAERRPLTVMVCDLAQAAQLVEQLDPEDLRHVMRVYHSTCERVLAKFDGYLAQRLGSRLVVYFGYPQAQEDAAQRAVLTGLRLLDALSALEPEVAQRHEVRLGLRVGIDSGLVVVETGGDERAAPVAHGSPQSRAVQLQEAAAPQSVVISSDTQYLVQGWFRCDKLSPHVFQGSDTPVAIYQVIERSGVQHRLEVAPPGGLTPLMGREHEVGLLSERWQRVCEGQGQVVVLSGEAGIGKSRLVQVLKEEVIREPHVLWECRSSPYYQNTALHPITELLQLILEWQSDDPPVTRLDKLEAFLSESRLSVSDTAPLLAPLSSLPLPARRYPPLGLSPQRQRQKTLETIVALLLEQAARQPVLLILEDLHWTDPTTLELLDLLIDQAPTARLLVLLTSRPEVQFPWRHRSYLTQIMLNRLSQSQIALMAEWVAAGKTLPGEALQQIVTKTDGVPLFVEEMTKAVLESGILKEVDGHYQLAGTVSILSIPATLQDSLMARLDRLSSAKGVAQYASVIGRQFSYELLQAVSGLDETMLQHELGRLIEAELVYQRGLLPQATYTFKHALIQDISYESLLRITRQVFHCRIANALEEKFSEIAENQPELLAYHYMEAGLSEQAITYWYKAGEIASKRSAYEESISHFNKALALLETLPDTPDRWQQELYVQVAVGLSLNATKGYAAPEVARAYARAQALSHQMRNTPQLFQILSGLWLFFVVKGQYQTSLELAEQGISVAQNQSENTPLLEAHTLMGTSRLFLGQFNDAQTHFEKVIALFHDAQQRAFDLRYGLDPTIQSHTYSALNLWLLGYPQQSAENIRKGLKLAQEIGNPFNQVRTELWISLLHQIRREESAFQQHSELGSVLANQHDFPIWVAVGTIMQGWSLVTKSLTEEGLTHMLQGLCDFQATGAKVFVPYYLSWLAETYRRMGKPDEGLALLTEAINISESTGDSWSKAELFRVKGNILITQTSDNASEAEICFQQAISIAQNQSAKSWELRAATSLARLWQSQGKRDETRELLEPIYSWFTEGFDTADLIDAKTLLDELASSEDSPIRHGPYDGSKKRSQTTRTLHRG